MVTFEQLEIVDSLATATEGDKAEALVILSDVVAAIMLIGNRTDWDGYCDCIDEFVKRLLDLGADMMKGPGVFDRGDRQ